MAFDWMTDDQLLTAASKARDAAHDAPKRLSGDPPVLSASMAWANRAHDWSELAAEIDRRGIKK